MTHLTWSIEKNSCCPTCGGKVLLAICGSDWSVDSESAIETFGAERFEQQIGWDVTVHEEITGHYCPQCQKLVSLSLNTMERDG